MNPLREFLRTQASPALATLGFKKSGNSFVHDLSGGDRVFLEFTIHRLDPRRDVFEVTLKYALSSFWAWLRRGEVEPKPISSTAAVAFAPVLPPEEFAFAPGQPRPFSLRWAAELPQDEQALARAFTHTVGTQIAELVNRMSRRPDLIDAFASPDGRIQRVAPRALCDVLLRIDSASSEEIDSFLARDDGPAAGEFAEWTRNYRANSAAES